jgi:hypothetical protein
MHHIHGEMPDMIKEGEKCKYREVANTKRLHEKKKKKERKKEKKKKEKRKKLQKKKKSTTRKDNECRVTFALACFTVSA